VETVELAKEPRSVRL
jgi:hypothetical protein